MNISYEINSWLEMQGFNAFAVIDFDNCSCYDSETDCIYFNPKEVSSSNAWTDFVSSLGGYNFNIPFPLQIFFHELGHSETYSKINQQDLMDSYISKMILNLQEGTMTNYDLDISYCQIPVELIATQWSLDYINTHETNIMELWNIIKKALS